ncbi:MAG: hypothetical protein ACOCXA_09980 [Planctomycetota bacterium]
MRFRILMLTAALLLTAQSGAQELHLGGSYTAKWQNDRPNVINGSINGPVEQRWTGNFTTDWKGRDRQFTGFFLSETMTAGPIRGDFYMHKEYGRGRRFLFVVSPEADASKLTGRWLEIKKKDDIYQLPPEQIEQALWQQIAEQAPEKQFVQFILKTGP